MFFGSGLKSDFRVFLEKRDICKSYIKKEGIFWYPCLQKEVCVSIFPDVFYVVCKCDRLFAI